MERESRAAVFGTEEVYERDILTVLCTISVYIGVSCVYWRILHRVNGPEAREERVQLVIR